MTKAPMPPHEQAAPFGELRRGLVPADGLLEHPDQVPVERDQRDEQEREETQHAADDYPSEPFTSYRIREAVL